MKKRTIGPGQLAGLVVLSLLTLGTETLPARLSSAGSAAWLCPLAAGGVFCLLAGLMIRRPLAGRTMLSGTVYPTGTRVLKALLLLWSLLAAAAQADRIGQRLAEDLQGSSLLLSAAALLLAVWMASGGVAALGRAGQIFAMATGLTFSSIVLFGLTDLRWDRIILWTGPELKMVPVGVLEVFEELSVGLYALLFLEDLEPKGERGRTRRGDIPVLFLLLSLGNLLVLGRLGPGLTGEVNRPFFQMVSGLGFPGAFQRLEELVSALWLPGDLMLLAVLMLSQSRLLAKLVGKEENGVLRCIPALTVLGLVLFRVPGSEWWGSAVSRLGGLGAGMILAFLAMISKKSEKNQKGG